MILYRCDVSKNTDLVQDSNPTFDIRQTYITIRLSEVGARKAKTYMLEIGSVEQSRKLREALQLWEDSQ